MSHEKTTQGSYKLRFQLTFEYNETFRIMRTSAHFDDALWLEAVQENPINLTLLGVDGIIAFTMVKVIEPDSSAPFPGFIGIGLAMAVAYIIEWRRQRAPP